MHCPACREGNCNSCPDKVMILLGKERICTCKRSGHDDLVNGEPRTQQVQDPFTEDIHAPGLIVKAESGALERTSLPSAADPTAR
jgi:hypothetical protein